MFFVVTTLNSRGGMWGSLTFERYGRFWPGIFESYGSCIPRCMINVFKIVVGVPRAPRGLPQVLSAVMRHWTTLLLQYASGFKKLCLANCNAQGCQHYRVHECHSPAPATYNAPRGSVLYINDSSGPPRQAEKERRQRAVLQRRRFRCSARTSVPALLINKTSF